MLLFIISLISRISHCFGEGLRLAKEKMDQKNLYFVNPSFDQ